MPLIDCRQHDPLGEDRYPEGLAEARCLVDRDQQILPIGVALSVWEREKQRNMRNRDG
jgi:hypothetical protein